jgi:hypothetical protein
VSYIADIDADNPLASLQAASCTYRIALGPRAGQKVLSLRTVAGRDEKTTSALCADAHGFSLHAGVRCGAHQRKKLERLCRYITRPAIANERLKRDGAGDVVLQLKSAPGATAPRTSRCRRWNSCSAWLRWCRVRACI